MVVMLRRCEYGLGKTRAHLFGLAHTGVQARLVMAMAAAAHDCLAQMILGDV
jgi:hypothetical protein